MNTQFNTLTKSLLVLGVFSITALIAYGVMNTSERVFKSTPYSTPSPHPYQTRNATADADLNRLTNGIGAGILDGVVARVKSKATERGGNPFNVKKYNVSIDTYLAGVDQLDNETRATLGSDYDFIFKYIYPRVYELRQVDNTPSSLFGKLGDMVDVASPLVSGEVRGSGTINTIPDSFTMYQDGKLIPKRDTVPLYILDKSKGTVTYKWNVKNVENVDPADPFGCRMTSSYALSGTSISPTQNMLDTDTYWNTGSTGQRELPLSQSPAQVYQITGQDVTPDDNVQRFVNYTQIRCGKKSKRWAQYSAVSPLDLNFIEVRDLSNSGTSTSNSTSSTTTTSTTSSAPKDCTFDMKPYFARELETTFFYFNNKSYQPVGGIMTLPGNMTSDFFAFQGQATNPKVFFRCVDGKLNISNQNMQPISGAGDYVPNFTYTRTNSAEGQYLTWTTSSKVRELHYTSTYLGTNGNGTVSDLVPLARTEETILASNEPLITPWAKLLKDGWKKGDYDVTWTATLNDGTKDVYYEKFSITY